MAKKIAVAINKGGVGKTTTTINLGVGLARRGKRVLMIDADPQGHLTIGLGFSKKTPVHLKELFERAIMDEPINAEDAILHHAEGVDIIPSNKLLGAMDVFLSEHEDGELILRRIVASVEERYDYMLFDCAPSNGKVTRNVLAAADSVIIPMNPQAYGLDSLREFIPVIRGVKKRYNPNLEIDGVLFNLDLPYRGPREIKKEVTESYGDLLKVFHVSIPRLEAFAQAPKQGVSVYSVKGADKKTAVERCEQLVEEVLANG